MVVVPDEPRLHVRPELVLYASSEEVIPGVNVRPWTGLDKMTDIDTISVTTNNIAKMKFKPHQKLELTRVYFYPR